MNPGRVVAASLTAAGGVIGLVATCAHLLGEGPVQPGFWPAVAHVAAIVGIPLSAVTIVSGLVALLVVTDK